MKKQDLTPIGVSRMATVQFNRHDYVCVTGEIFRRGETYTCVTDGWAYLLFHPVTGRQVSFGKSETVEVTDLTQRVARAKRSAERLKAATHTMGTRKESALKLTKQELDLNRHNAKAERTHAARLLRASRRGLTGIKAYWAAARKEVA
jgi:hypothetical protein